MTDEMGEHLLAMERPAKERISYHEAGHIVAAFAHNVKVESATIVPTNDYSGLVITNDEDIQKAPLETEIIIRLSGPVAEELFFGAAAGGMYDYAMARRLAEPLHSDFIVTDAYLDYLIVRARQSLQHHLDLVVAFARTLMQRGTLTRDEIARVVVETACLESPPAWRSDKEGERDASFPRDKGDTWDPAGRSRT
jgi:ATP-dependent Zn protease